MGDGTPPQVPLQKPGAAPEQAGGSRRAEGGFSAADGVGGPVLSVGAPTDLWPPCLPAWTREGPSLWLLHSLSGKVTLTCFIRSKSKASKATSFTLPTGFILERVAGCGKEGSRSWRAPATRGQIRQAGVPGPPSAGPRPGRQALPSSYQKLLLLRLASLKLP